MRKLFIVSTAFLLAASTCAHAQRQGSAVQYRWHDAHGLPHFSDSLTADAMANGYEIVNSSGIVIGHVARQLTPEERAAAAKQAEIAAAAKRAADEKHRNEMQMLAAYPEESDLVSAQKGELASIDEQITTTRKSLANQESALADLLERAGELERAKQTVPKYLADRVSDQRNVVGSQRALLDRLQASYTSAQARQQAQLARYRELKDEIKKGDAGY